MYIVYNIENTLKQCQISLVPCHFPVPSQLLQTKGRLTSQLPAKMA